MTKHDVIAAIERRKPTRIPMVRAKWWGEGLEEQYGDRLRVFDSSPEDVTWLFMENPVNPDAMNLSWRWKSDGAQDNIIVHDDGCL